MPVPVSPTQRGFASIAEYKEYLKSLRESGVSEDIIATLGDKPKTEYDALLNTFATTPNPPVISVPQTPTPRVPPAPAGLDISKAIGEAARNISGQEGISFPLAAQRVRKTIVPVSPAGVPQTGLKGFGIPKTTDILKPLQPVAPGIAGDESRGVVNIGGEVFSVPRGQQQQPKQAKTFGQALERQVVNLGEGFEPELFKDIQTTRTGEPVVVETLPGWLLRLVNAPVATLAGGLGAAAKGKVKPSKMREEVLGTIQKGGSFTTLGAEAAGKVGEYGRLGPVGKTVLSIGATGLGLLADILIPIDLGVTDLAKGRRAAQATERIFKEAQEAFKNSEPLQNAVDDFSAVNSNLYKYAEYPGSEDDLLKAGFKQDEIAELARQKFQLENIIGKLPFENPNAVIDQTILDYIKYTESLSPEEAKQAAETLENILYGQGNKTEYVYGTTVNDEINKLFSKMGITKEQSVGNVIAGDYADEFDNLFKTNATKAYIENIKKARLDPDAIFQITPELFLNNIDANTLANKTKTLLAPINAEEQMARSGHVNLRRGDIENISRNVYSGDNILALTLDQRTAKGLTSFLTAEQEALLRSNGNVQLTSQQYNNMVELLNENVAVDLTNKGVIKPLFLNENNELVTLIPGKEVDVKQPELGKATVSRTAKAVSKGYDEALNRAVKETGSSLSVAEQRALEQVKQELASVPDSYKKDIADEMKRGPAPRQEQTVEGAKKYFGLQEETINEEELFATLQNKGVIPRMQTTGDPTFKSVDPVVNEELGIIPGLNKQIEKVNPEGKQRVITLYRGIDFPKNKPAEIPIEDTRGLTLEDINKVIDELKEKAGIKEKRMPTYFLDEQEYVDLLRKAMAEGKITYEEIKVLETALIAQKQLEYGVSFSGEIQIAESYAQTNYNQGKDYVVWAIDLPLDFVRSTKAKKVYGPYRIDHIEVAITTEDMLNALPLLRNVSSSRRPKVFFSTVLKDYINKSKDISRPAAFIRASVKPFGSAEGFFDSYVRNMFGATNRVVDQVETEIGATRKDVLPVAVKQARQLIDTILKDPESKLNGIRNKFVGLYKQGKQKEAFDLLAKFHRTIENSTLEDLAGTAVFERAVTETAPQNTKMATSKPIVTSENVIPLIGLTSSVRRANNIAKKGTSILEKTRGVPTTSMLEGIIDEKILDIPNIIEERILRIPDFPPDEIFRQMKASSKPNAPLIQDTTGPMSKVLQTYNMVSAPDLAYYASWAANVKRGGLNYQSWTKTLGRSKEMQDYLKAVLTNKNVEFYRQKLVKFIDEMNSWFTFNIFDFLKKSRPVAEYAKDFIMERRKLAAQTIAEFTEFASELNTETVNVFEELAEVLKTIRTNKTFTKQNKEELINNIKTMATILEDNVTYVGGTIARELESMALNDFTQTTLRNVVETHVNKNTEDVMQFVSMVEVFLKPFALTSNTRLKNVLQKIDAIKAPQNLTQKTNEASKNFIEVIETSPLFNYYKDLFNIPSPVPGRPGTSTLDLNPVDIAMAMSNYIYEPDTLAKLVLEKYETLAKVFDDIGFTTMDLVNKVGIDHGASAEELLGLLTKTNIGREIARELRSALSYKLVGETLETMSRNKTNINPEVIKADLSVDDFIKKVAQVKLSTPLMRRFGILLENIVGDPKTAVSEGWNGLMGLTRQGLLGGSALPNFAYHVANALTGPAIIASTLGLKTGIESLTALGKTNVRQVIHALHGSPVDNIVAKTPSGQVYTAKDIANIIASSNINQSGNYLPIAQDMLSAFAKWSGKNLRGEDITLARQFVRQFDPRTPNVGGDS